MFNAENLKELSDYDLETAEGILISKLYLYVGFMCHQTIEKAFKAYFSKLNPETAPLTHSLSYLAKKGGFCESLSELQKEIIDQIEPLNIEVRYPSHKERLLRSLMEGDFFTINPLLWKFRRQVDDRIEPILIESEFDDADFIGEIQKSGIEIA